MVLFSTLQEISQSFLGIMQKELVYSFMLYTIVFLLTQLIKKRSVYILYGLWTLIFLRLILPPDISLSFSVASFFGIDFLASSSTFSTLRSATWLVPSLPVALFLFWISCTTILTFLFIKKYFYYHGVIRQASPVNTPFILETTVSWRKRFGIKRPIRIVSSDKSLSPFTMGIVQPVIYLPGTMLSKVSNETIESVIAHELAHIKNFDALWMKLQCFIQILYFFYPVVWIANSKLNQVRERICDELVLSDQVISPKVYGKSMLSVLKMNLFGVEGVQMLPGFGNHKKRFSERIRDIMQIERMKQSSFLKVNLLLLLCSIFILPMAKGSDNPSKSVDLQKEAPAKLKPGFSDDGTNCPEERQVFCPSKTKEKSRMEG